MNNKVWIKKILTYAGIAAFFFTLAYLFVPQVIGGKIINQSDHSGWKGMTQEIAQHNDAYPEDETQWTNSMFGGMPTVAMYDDFKGDWTAPLYKAVNSLAARPANWLFIAMLGGFLLFLAFGTHPVVAAGGAIAIAFCSYNIQIIQVGHNTKMQAIAFMPWVLAGLVFTYRSALAAIHNNPSSPRGQDWKEWLPKTVLGAVLFALALSFQIKANHPQITYYLALVIFIYAITLFIWLCASKTEPLTRENGRRTAIGKFFAASILLLVIGGTGIATNLNKLIPTYEYTRYTMRGGSELSPDSDTHNDKGLDIGYATAWSYGIEETPNLLIPNFNGGSSAGAIDPEKSETYDLLKNAGQPNLNQVMKSLPLYWGPQPFTAGPMYMGAISIFLFILGLLLYRGKEKWWLLAATILAVFLAWGSHFMWFTRLMFEYAPMYNKFRTVSMALVVLQVTLPLLGFLVLDRIIKAEYDRKSVLKALGISYAITAGFCLVCIAVPGIAGSFTAASDAGQPEVLAEALAADRRTLLTGDALRSLLFISGAAGILLWALTARGTHGKDRKGQAVSDNGFQMQGRLMIAAAVIAVLVLSDMFSIGKRYLNKDHFVTKRDFSSQFAQRPVDKIILQDSNPDYRVLDLSVNTFNDSHPSYWHKSIGGYSPAKLQRYQDLIDRYINGEINRFYDTLKDARTIGEIEEKLPYLPVVSMLNGKYIIVGEDYAPVVNANAFGNCWIVDDFVTASTPDEELALLGSVDLRETAVIGDDFKWAQDAVAGISRDFLTSGDRAWEGDYEINLTSYRANELRYSCSFDAERAVIFSEIYYPDGWKAWIEPAGQYGLVKNGHYQPTDGAQPLDLFRADWILRGAILPAGEYEVVMRFEPESYLLGERLSRASSITLLILLLLAGAGMAVSKKRIK